MDTTSLILFVAAFVPAAFYMLYIIAFDDDKPEPPLALLMGALVGIGAAFAVKYVWPSAGTQVGTTPSWQEGITTGFLGLAVPAEIVKWIALFIFLSLNKYYDEGLRIIEVYKHQFKDLNDVIAQIKNRNYKFILYMDDLSFEEFEIEYKYLKAVIEGGLEKKPDNILIYATSNRRHLVKEKSTDKLEIAPDDDLHSSDTVQEKLSLVYRFGVRIYFGAPDKKAFQNIVRVLADRNGVHMPEDQLMLEANKWELSHGGLTGRTAQQFIDHLLGTVVDKQD